MQYDYGIAVATVNGPKRLEDFLLSVAKHTAGLNYVVSICDDCSSDELSRQNYALAIKHNCFYHRNSERSGVPYSWNRAIQAMDAKHFIVANDDIVVVKGWLHAYDAFRKYNDGLALGVLAWPATNEKNSLSNNDNHVISCDASHIATPIVACAGYLFGFTKEMYQDVGGFDERYFATWEEIDFGAKLCMNGLKSVGLNGPVIYHEGGASFSDPINQHPALVRQSFAQSQWIEKWSNILNIDRDVKDDSSLIREISNALIAKIPNYSQSDFAQVSFSVSGYNPSFHIEPRQDIDGWFDWPELYKSILNKYNSGSHFVEVGSWMGKSACYMSELIKKSGKSVKFDCVDIWDDNSAEPAYSLAIETGRKSGKTLLDIFKDNLNRYGVLDFVNPIKMPSVAAAKKFKNQSVDMIFIDAAHDYENVKNDLNVWWPKLKVGGTFAGHDWHYSQDGVQRAVKEFCAKHNLNYKVVGQCWVVDKNAK